jgi:hypothetical protein
VQDRYAGDVGDFLKLGLLRHLAAPTSAGGAGLRVGVNWYLAPDEAHNADGRHTAYLHPGNRHHASLERCDPELMRILEAVVEKGARSVRALESSGVLPRGSITYSERLGQPGDGRGDWHLRALGAMAEADVVFADPDNGFTVESRPKLHKYALTGELGDYAHRGQSLLVYQHMDRSEKAEPQARKRLELLAKKVRQTPVGAVIAHRGTCRFFLATAAVAHEEQFTRALQAFVRGPGAVHTNLVR